LTRIEFERRYDAMPELKKAELIEGVVHMPSPVRWNRQARPHAALLGWLLVYEASTPGVQAGGDSSLRLDLDNEPQPDAALIVDPARGGRVRLSADDYVVGGPELVAEVSASSVSIDLNTKLRVYRRNEVQEYLVWRVLQQAVDWFVLRQGQYEPLAAGPDALLRSEVFPGLWLDPAALTQGDPAALLQALQRGLASPEHADLVARLQQAAPGAS
jgi:Uma2 family endonuclease